MPAVRRPGEHACRAGPDRQAGRGRRGRHQGLRRARPHQDRRDQGQRREGGAAAAHQGRLRARRHRRSPGLAVHAARAPASFVPAGTLAARRPLEWHRRDAFGEARSIGTRSPRPPSPAGCSPTASSVSTHGHEPVADDRGDDGHRRRARLGDRRARHGLPGRAPPRADGRDPGHRRSTAGAPGSTAKVLGDFVDALGPADARRRHGGARPACSPRRCRSSPPTCGASSRPRAIVSAASVHRSSTST